MAEKMVTESGGGKAPLTPSFCLAFRRMLGTSRAQVGDLQPGALD
jgi:hypothetical protein